MCVCLTLCARRFAGLHETQKGDEVLDDAEVLGTRGAAGVDGHGHQELLDVTHQEPVVIWRDAAEQERRKSECDVEGTQNQTRKRMSYFIHGSKTKTKNKTQEPREVFR